MVRRWKKLYPAHPNTRDYIMHKFVHLSSSSKSVETFSKYDPSNFEPGWVWCSCCVVPWLALYSQIRTLISTEGEKLFYSPFCARMDRLCKNHTLCRRNLNIRVEAVVSETPFKSKRDTRVSYQRTNLSLIHYFPFRDFHNEYQSSIDVPIRQILSNGLNFFNRKITVLSLIHISEPTRPY